MIHHVLNKALRLLLVTNGLILIAAATLGPIYALFVKELGGDLMDASLAATLFALSAGIVTLVSGKFSDDVRHSEWVMIFGYLMIAFGFIFYFVLFCFCVKRFFKSDS
jgi:tellurite resistance protein TehA-like permease